jgi:hypothetical protein
MKFEKSMDDELSDNDVTLGTYYAKQASNTPRRPCTTINGQEENMYLPQRFKLLLTPSIYSSKGLSSFLPCHSPLNRSFPPSLLNT